MDPITVLALLLLLNPNADKMSKKDLALEAAYMGFHAIDWGQTRDIALNHCDSPDFNNMSDCEGGRSENNPFIGSKPTTEEVDKYMLSTALLHAGITRSLPKKYRKKFQMLTIGMEAGFVHHNAKIGLKVRW
jgi:hypothetical protein